MDRMQLVLDDELQSFMQHFCLREEMPPARRDCLGYTALISGDSFDVGYNLPAGFIEVASWAEGNARRVWADLQRDAICTYCEHDLRLEVFKSSAAFFAATERARAFYTEPEHDWVRMG